MNGREETKERQHRRLRKMLIANLGDGEREKANNGIRRFFGPQHTARLRDQVEKEENLNPEAIV